MASSVDKSFSSSNKYKLSRRGRKLSLTDDSKLITALPKDIPERTWAEVLQKEENDLVILEIREEIFEQAINICYKYYMEKQTISFTVHCAMKAWLKLIDWYFYRHDPGEDVSAWPECYIPNRTESWHPDDPPEPSPRDTYCREKLVIMEEDTGSSTRAARSTSSIELPVIDEIPREYWFPGKINFEVENDEKETSGFNYASSDTSLQTSGDTLAAESEVLQKVTDYSDQESLPKEEEELSKSEVDNPPPSISRGAGDALVRASLSRRRSRFVQPIKPSVTGRSRHTLPPLDIPSSSQRSLISDCRLRNLRLDTYCEVSSEKMDTPPTETEKRK